MSTNDKTDQLQCKRPTGVPMSPRTVSNEVPNGHFRELVIEAGLCKVACVYDVVVVELYGGETTASIQFSDAWVVRRGKRVLLSKVAMLMTTIDSDKSGVMLSRIYDQDKNGAETTAISELVDTLVDGSVNERDVDRVRDRLVEFVEQSNPLWTNRRQT